jgi:Flp pilus assembly protein TadG
MKIKGTETRAPLKMASDKGATVVEFALVLPIFALLLFSTIEFGNYFFVQHTLQFATREGTRLALVGATLNDPKGNPMSRQASIIQTIKDHASLAVNPDALRINIFPVGAGYTDPANWDKTTDPGVGGSYMRVRVQYTFNFLTPLIQQFFPAGQHVITAEALYRNELF